MPLPSDEKLIALSEEILKGFEAIFGAHPGFRPAHAKGKLLEGTFTPTEAAAGLSKAEHLNAASTAVTVRFSDSTGLPLIPDNDPNANPKGMAIRFHLADTPNGRHAHTDIVSHSTDGFPARTGAEFLEFLHAIAASSDQTKPHPWPVEAYVGSHPAALAFVQAPKPFPVSFATEGYFGVTAMKFINYAGEAKFGRYRIVPVADAQYLDDAAAKEKSGDYLVDEIVERVAKDAVEFKLQVQVAGPDDVVDDATIHWPEDREIVELGTISLTKAVEDEAEVAKRIIFDPIPRLAGIEPSDDPLLELRAAVYLISGRRRRSA